MVGVTKKIKESIIPLHSFRRFVKTTISDLGYSDYSEWFIGHRFYILEKER